MAINQLPAANYTPAKFSMEAVSPRPNAESDPSGGAYYRYYHASMPYKARVAVRGGAWPLHYELTTAPAGATIGNNYGDADYGVISWASPTGASETFTVTVTDQEGNTPLVVTWTATLAADDASRFVFVDADVAGPGTGTFADPFSDIDDILSGHANKIAVLRGSTAQYLPAGALALGNTTYPSTLMGFHGESPIVDGANGRTNVNDTSADDLSIINIIYDGSETSPSGHSHAVVPDMNGGQGKRFLIWGCTFRNQNEGAGLSNDNPACIWFSGQTAEREYVAVVDNVQESTSITPFLNTFDVKRLLVENNTIADIDLTVNYGGSNTIHVSIKDRTSYFTFRNNSIIAPSHAGVMITIFQQNNDVNTTDQEVCWNTLVATSTYSSGLLDWNGQSGEYTVVPNMYQYRNSIKAVNSGYCTSYNYFPTGTAPANPAYAVTVEDELWSNSGPGRYIIILNGNANNDGTVDTDLKYTFGAVAPVILDSSTEVDANGLLTGAARTIYLGTVGAEVVASTSIATPTIDASGNLVVEFSEVVSDGGSGIDDFTIAGRTLSNFVLDASGNTITADVSPVFEATDNNPEVVYTQPTGGLQTVGAVDVPSFSILATNNSTQDNTAPVLSSTTGTTTGATTATGTVDTDEGGGFLWYTVTTGPTDTSGNILNGTSQAVSGTGTQIVSATSLTSATGYYFHFIHVDAASNVSNKVDSPLFTTDSLVGPTLFFAQVNSSGNNLLLTFSEAVQEAGSEAAVTLSNGVTLAAPSGTGTTALTFGLSPYVQAGETITVSFAGGSNVIEQNGGGADVEAFAGSAVTNISTATPPAIQGTPSINATGTLLTFFFDDLLDNLTTPIDAPFSLVGGAYTFTNSSLVGTGASFVISPAVQQGDVLTLSFVEAANTFTSTTSALAVESFSGVAITNNSTAVTVPPVFTSAPAVSKTTLTGHTIRQTIDKAGTVYGVMVADGGNTPSPEQIKAGTDGLGAAPVSVTSVAATAGNPCVLTFSGGAKNTAYDYYIVAEDTVPNLQASVVKVTATTENLLFNGSGGGGLPAAGPKKKVKMKWEESKRKGKK